MVACYDYTNPQQLNGRSATFTTIYFTSTFSVSTALASSNERKRSTADDDDRLLENFDPQSEASKSIFVSYNILKSSFAITTTL
ncbi:hypothetical protein BC938DRAFT_481761 [Jimgerdemannia flammicorona]|uniref:Uncharacterized protein n=1 Tax=Jimgerdemannia flammicorona TaxID=994334 RepID=A0A433QFI6_9FUNG|nr:hypothetical protein BC938DRAFT_481761 [Jimgerdemannia flammicorona]